MFFPRISHGAVLRNLSAIAVSNIFLQLLGFVYRIFLSRMTGAEGMGVYQLIMPFYSLLTSLTLTGLTVAVAKISAERASLGDFSGARKSVSSAVRIFSFSLFLAALFTFFFHDFICNAFLGDIRVLPSLPFLFICLFLTGLENIMKNYFYGVGRVAPQITSELSEQIIRALAVVGLLYFFSPSSAAISSMLIICGMIVSELSSSFILSMFYRFGKRKPQTARPSPPKARELTKISLPISTSQSINNLLSTLNCALIPQRLRASGMSASAATGSFGVMFGMTMPLLSFPIAFIAALTSVMVPKISEAFAKGDFADMRRKAGKTIHATGLLAMPLTAIMIPLGRPLGELLFAQNNVGNLMFPLCIATLISYYELTLGALLNAIGKQTRSAIYIISTGILQLVFTWLVGIPGIGMRGFVVGSIVSGGICASLQFLCLCRELSLSPRFENWFFSPFLASVLCAFVAEIVYTFSGSLLVAATTSLATYFLSLWSLGTNPVRYIKTLIPKEDHTPRKIIKPHK